MKQIPAIYDNVERWTFGYTEEETKHLLELITLGVKTATCTLYEADNLPEAGDAFIIIGADSEPACSVEVTHVKVTTFLKVDEEHARAEGEGDLSLAYWQNQTRAFFEEFNMFSYDMPLVCIQFKLLEVFDN
ncbi:ASCH domain-containing protein [Thorsellia kenyensis]|uniref:ASCH domain-containing protein n=1 Tax=Thorsellia kenyensis TaxID=1549888 RepID=A0ABV6C9K6_9GAMM